MESAREFYESLVGDYDTDFLKIEARDAAIRKECADKAIAFFYVPEDSAMEMELRAEIEGKGGEV